MNSNNERIAFHESKTGGILHRFVRFCTRWAWRKHVNAPINYMFERGLIDSRVFHEGHAFAARMIDSTPPTPLREAFTTVGKVAVRTAGGAGAGLLLACMCFYTPACTSITPNEQAVLTTTGQLANVVATAAATIYAGPAAGALASDTLNALGKVVQSYVGVSSVPAAILQAAPGVPAIAAAVMPLISSKTIPTQADANKIYAAAAIANTIAVALTSGT